MKGEKEWEKTMIPTFKNTFWTLDMTLLYLIGQNLVTKPQLTKSATKKCSLCLGGSIAKQERREFYVCNNLDIYFIQGESL